MANDKSNTWIEVIWGSYDFEIGSIISKIRESYEELNLRPLDYTCSTCTTKLQRTQKRATFRQNFCLRQLSKVYFFQSRLICGPFISCPHFLSLNTYFGDKLSKTLARERWERRLLQSSNKIWGQLSYAWTNCLRTFCHDCEPLHIAVHMSQAACLLLHQQCWKGSK